MGRLPEHDRISMTREKMHADLVVAMGGRAAEEIIFGRDKVTSGASSDIMQATDLARSMVTKWGMSDKVGPLAYETTAESNKHGFSDKTSELIDQEVKNLVSGSLKKATEILQEKIEDLHNLAKALIE